MQLVNFQGSAEANLSIRLNATSIGGDDFGKLTQQEVHSRSNVDDRYSESHEMEESSSQKYS